MDLERCKQDFDRDGFLVLRGFLSPEELRHLRAHTESCISQTSRPTGYGGVAKGLQQLDPWFEQQLVHGKHTDLISALLNDDLEPATVGWFDRLPGEDSGVKPHLDAIGNGRSGATLWIALDRADRENGCLFYVKGSHLQKLPLEYDLKGFDAETQGATAIEAAPGDAIIHSSFTVHWSEANRCQRPRQAITYFYWAASQHGDSREANGDTST